MLSFLICMLVIGDVILNFCRLLQKTGFWSAHYTPVTLRTWNYYKTLRNIYLCSYLQCIGFSLQFQSWHDCSVELLLVITQQLIVHIFNF